MPTRDVGMARQISPIEKVGVASRLAPFACKPREIVRQFSAKTVASRLRADERTKLSTKALYAFATQCSKFGARRPIGIIVHCTCHPSHERRR